MRTAHTAKALDPEPFIKGVAAGDRVMLARAITLIESSLPAHMRAADTLMQAIMPMTGNSVRVGITGVPGVGKSTFIEALGCRLCDEGLRLAVLAVDPSSSLSKGSVLGDKTRMEELSRRQNCFIRPSPSGCVFGGVARRSREAMLLCEAAGYDTIFIETVGVGQSETTVRSMVDFFLVLLLAGAGDDLQGVKKGIMELADGLVITKADGPNKIHAEAARASLERVVHWLHSPTPGWHAPVRTCSSATGEGIREVYGMVESFMAKFKANGGFDRRRADQRIEWVRNIVEQELIQEFYGTPAVSAEWTSLEADLRSGVLSPSAAARRLLSLQPKH